VMPAMFALLINVAREIVKDMEDVEGDRKQHAWTLPVKYGLPPAMWLTSFVIVVLIGTTIGAYLWNIYSSFYLYVVLVVDAILSGVLVILWRDQSPRMLNHLSQALKICMVLGLLAIYFGSV
jgi:geranylgeranylglycerol-phosphate geranylgeranyltransferase